MDIPNLTASILLADLQRRGFFKQPGSINDIVAASKLVSEILYADNVNRDAGGEPEMQEPSFVTIMDPPDVWGIRHNLGLAELAARLGSIVTFDKRGNIVWMDNFESGIEAWGIAAGSLEWTSTQHRNGGFSARLYTIALADARTEVQSGIPIQVLSQMGFEFSFLNDYNGRLKTIRFWVEGGINTRIEEPSIKWTAATRTWSYQAELGAWVDLAPTMYLAAYSHTPIFHTVKLVADFAKKEYVRLIVDNQIYNLSGIKHYRLLFGSNHITTLNLEIVTNSNNVCNVYLDDMIVTQNEPA